MCCETFLSEYICKINISLTTNNLYKSHKVTESHVMSLTNIILICAKNQMY